jgi:hypothetical protein
LPHPLEVRFGLRRATQQEQGQAPSGVGHDVLGVDPQVLAAVLQNGPRAAPAVVEDDADQLPRRGLGVEPEGRLVAGRGESVPFVIVGIAARDQDEAVSGVERQRPVEVGDGAGEVAEGQPGAAPVVVAAGVPRLEGDRPIIGGDGQEVSGGGPDSRRDWTRELGSPSGSIATHAHEAPRNWNH